MSENPLDYSFVFERKGKYNDVWLAATNEKRFNQQNRRTIDRFQIGDICKGIETDILHVKDVTSRDSGEKRSKKPPKKKRRRIIQDTEDTQGDANDHSAFNLKLASNLMMGTARIWRTQVLQLYEESKLMVSKQASYNAFIHAETVEEERRKARVYYGEKLEGGKAKGGKKKTNNVPTQFTLDDFEEFEENIVKGHEQNKVFEELTLNTAHNDQITIRETNFQLPTSFPLSIDNEMGLNDFEPLDQEDIDFFFEGDASQMIDEVREAPAEIVPQYGMSDSSFEEFSESDLPESKIQEAPPVYMNELVEEEIEYPTPEEPIEMQFEQQSLVVEEPHEDIPDPEPESSDNEIEDFYSVAEDDLSRTITPVPMPKVTNKRAPIVRKQDPFAMHLSRLSKESLTDLKATKAKKGQKRKIDAVTKISYNSMVCQMEDTSDIVQPITPLPPLKKFRFATPAFLLKQSSHSWRAYISDVLTHDFSLKVKFLSLSEKTRKRKLKAVSKNDVPNKRLRLTDRELVPTSSYAEIEAPAPPKVRLDVRPEPFIPEPVSHQVHTFVQEEVIVPPPLEVPFDVQPEPNSFVPEPVPYQIPTSGYGEMIAPPLEVPLDVQPELNSFVPEPVSYPVLTSGFEEMIAPQEIAPEVRPPPEPLMPEPVLDHILNELREEEALAEPSDEQSMQNPDMEASQWKRVKENWGQIPLLKKLIGIFRNKRLGWPTIEMLIEQERNRKVGTVTFSSLIHLKAKHYLILKKNDHLEIIRIEQGRKLQDCLSKLA